MLQAVLEFGILTTSHIARLFFPTIKKANRRLRILTDAGLLIWQEKPGSSFGRRERVYSLRKKGVEAIADGDVDGAYPRNRSTRHLQTNLLLLNHRLATNEFIIDLMLACQEQGKYTCSFIPEQIHMKVDRKKRKTTAYIADQAPDIEHPGRKIDFIPDAVICLGNTEGKKALLFLEMDMATQSLTGQTGAGYTVVNKLRAYTGYMASQGYSRYNDVFGYDFSGFRLLWVTTDSSRMGHVIELSLRVNGRGFSAADFTWLAMQEDVSEGTALEPIWCRADREDHTTWALVGTSKKGKRLGSGVGSKRGASTPGKASISRRA